MRATTFFRRVFVANRGEIAVRVVRACDRLGIESVVAVSEADRDSLAARLATRAVCIGPARATESYLRPEILVAAALGTGCEAVHPGYGFLSERAAFSRLCAEVGLVFIGPRPRRSRVGTRSPRCAWLRRRAFPRAGSDSITTRDVRAAPRT